MKQRFPVSLPSHSVDKKATQACPCGYLTDNMKECRCSPQAVQKYVSRLSGPLLDRIDLHVDVPAVPIRELARRADPAEKSESIRTRVNEARTRQIERYRDLPGIHCNAHLGSRDLKVFCRLDDESQATLEKALTVLGLSARAFDRILKVSRTIADLAAAPEITVDHISEAITYRTLDRSVWNSTEGNA